jgi:hypothetical protein
MFYYWFKGIHSGSCEHASSYYLVACVPISMRSRDHPSGTTPKGSSYHPSSPKGYPCSDTNLEGPKGLSVEMEECHKQGICYYCDENYAPWNKCREKKFFQIDVVVSSSYEYLPLDEALYPKVAQPIDHVKDPVVNLVESEEPVISLHALLGISAPQTLKLKGYIKHNLIVVLIDSGNTIILFIASLQMRFIALFTLFLIFKFSLLMGVL